jgi:MFS family permease
MRRLIRKEWQLLLFGFVMTFCSSPGQTFFISLFSAEIRSTLNLSHSAFSGAYSLATLCSAVVVLWSGALLDRIPLKQFTTLIIAGLSCSVALLALGHHIALLIVAFFLLRHFGQALMMLAASTTMVRYLDQHKGKANALSGLGYVSAEAVLPGTVIALIAIVGWQATLYVTGAVLMLLILPLCRFLLRNHQQRHNEYLTALNTPTSSSSNAIKAEKRKQWSRSEVLRDASFYLFLPAVLSQSMLFTGFIFHQLHIVESKGWSLTWWGVLFGMYATIAIACKLLSGFAVDKIGALKILPWGSLPMALGLFALASTSHQVAAVLFFIGLGITTGVQTTLAAPLWSELYGSRHLGAIKSLASALLVFGTALLPFLMGALIDSGVSIEHLAFTGACYTLLCCLLAGIGLLRKMRLE